jgi:hypothetical protein
MRAEDSMSIEQLRTELRREWDDRYALVDALQALPEVPEYRVLRLLAEAAFYGRPSRDDFQSIGMRVQREAGFSAVPLKAEIEAAAGMWVLIRRALDPSHHV